MMVVTVAVLVIALVAVAVAAVASFLLVVLLVLAGEHPLEGRTAAVLGLIQTVEISVKRILRIVLIVRPIAAKLFDGVADLHILVVIELVFLGETFQKIYGSLVPVAPEQTGEQSDVLALVKIADQAHVYRGVSFVARKYLDEHLSRLAI